MVPEFGSLINTLHIDVLEVDGMLTVVRIWVCHKSLLSLATRCTKLAECHISYHGESSNCRIVANIKPGRLWKVTLCRVKGWSDDAHMAILRGLYSAV